MSIYLNLECDYIEVMEVFNKLVGVVIRFDFEFYFLFFDKDNFIFLNYDGMVYYEFVRFEFDFLN